MTKCLGCGSDLQSDNTSKEGFVKSSVIDKSSYCERCFKIKHYGEYSVLDKKIDYDGLFRNINSDTLATVVFLIDSLNINDNVLAYLKKFKNNKFVVLTKFDVLPKSVKDKKIIQYFKENIFNTDNIMCVSSFKNYNIDNFLSTLKSKKIRRAYIVGYTNSGKSTFINSLVTSLNGIPVITTSAIPNTTASYITIKIDSYLTIVDTPGFIDNTAFYNFIDISKLSKLYPKKEIKVKTFQVRSGYSVVVNDFLRIDNLSNHMSSFSFYMNDKLRYEKVKIKNDKLKILPSKTINVNDLTDVIINGLGFIKIAKETQIKVYTLDNSLIKIRKSMI